MNDSPQYKQQQTEPKQCKSEVKGLRIHQETDHCSIQISENKHKSWFHAKENFSK